MSSPTTPASIGPGEFFPVVGVGPHEKPWPEGDQYDPELLLNGDRRNVLDHYRYWTVEAIVKDLNTKRHKLQIAIENWQHDLNIGSIVRTANAFNVSGVHIVGKRDWNKRGEMVTDFCAGAGGKTLAIGAAMRSTGRLYASSNNSGLC